MQFLVLRGRKRGSKNDPQKALIKATDRLVAELAIAITGDIKALGKDRLAELDNMAMQLVQVFAPKKDAQGNIHWGEGDEARFYRCVAMAGKYAEARAPYESPRLSAIAAGNLAGQAPDPNDDPHARLMRIIDNWIAADEAEKAERVAQGLPANETEALRLENASLREEVARLRGLPAPEGERVIDPPTSDIVPPGEQGRLYVGPSPLGPR